jgi:DNA-binding CsgD family transcriptional regulator
MPWILLIWVVVNAVLFVVLLVYALGLQRRWKATSIRFIATALVLAAGTFLVTSIQRLGVQAARAEIVPVSWEDFFLTTYHLVLSFVGTVAGIYAITRLRIGIRRLEDGERMLSALTDNVPERTDTSKWNLTARESQVLQTIVLGKTSDEQIAESLFISTATAATHVRNILRKTGLSSRMDLMLVASRLHRDD